MAYKVFTNGSVLQASEVNDNLMKQAVATFSNAAARTAAITAPVEGQMTWLEDVNAYQFWNGSAWVSAALGTGSGLVHVVSQTVGSGVSSVTISNAFSATYDDYKILYTGGVASAANYFVGRLGLNGTPATGVNYKNSFVTVNYSTSAVTGAGDTSSAFSYLGRHNTNWVDLTLEVRAPFLARQTRIAGAFSLDGTSGAVTNGVHELANSYNDFVLLAGSGTLTGGTISVYGYKKA